MLAEAPASAILRPTWFFDNFRDGSFRHMVTDGEIRLPAGDGRIPLVDVRDIGAVAAAALASDGPEGVLPLTGPETIDHHQVARAFSEALGRSIEYTPVSVPEFVELMQRRGFGDDYAQFLGEALMDVAEGRLTIPVHRTVDAILGREALDLNAFAATLVSGRGQSSTSSPS